MYQKLNNYYDFDSVLKKLTIVVSKSNAIIVIYFEKVFFDCLSFTF